MVAAISCETDHAEPAMPDCALKADQVSERFLARIPRDFAREHLIVSQGFDGLTEKLAVAGSTSALAIINTGACLERKVTSVVTEAGAIARLIDAAFARTVNNAEPSVLDIIESTDIDVDVDRLIAGADRDLLSTSGKAPVVRLVDAVLFEALSRGASDIHIQPLPATTLIRYRLDGVLYTVRELSHGLTIAVVSRLKVMARMDIAERRNPQDGRASVTISDRHIDLRISTLPTNYGERAVIRLLDNTRQLCELNQIGMAPELQEMYLDRATRAHGIILVTGPTGSGKTTTLYSTLRRIGTSTTNIMTIEDPIEYDLGGLMARDGRALAISQSQVNGRKGITFASGLRHLLRQDPDVIMVGEVRDAETARIAMQSSLTGHLVLSTLHTNDAISAVTRLVDLGIEDYLVSASLSAVLAQRLVRTIHAPCEGAGCEACLQTGFRGRTGLFELLVIDELAREVISRGATTRALRRCAMRSGMRSLAEEGERLVSAGQTTKAEVDRVVRGNL